MALYLVSSDERLDTLPKPDLEVSPLDFSFYEGKTREVLLKTDKFRDQALWWTEGQQGNDRVLYLNQRPEKGKAKALLQKTIPSWLSESERKSFIGILTKISTHLMDEEDMPTNGVSSDATPESANADPCTYSS